MDYRKILWWHQQLADTWDAEVKKLEGGGEPLE